MKTTENSIWHSYTVRFMFSERKKNQKEDSRFPLRIQISFKKYIFL